MKGENQKELHELLQELLHSIYSVCTKGLAENRFKSESRLYLRRKILSDKYDNNGYHITSWQEEKSSEKVWQEATKIIEQGIKKLSIYSEVSKRIHAIYNVEEKPCEHYLSRLINVIAWRTLEGEIPNKLSLEPYILSFLRDLNNEEQRYKVIAQIKGVILQPDSIQLDRDTLLKKPTREDIEIKRHVYSIYSREYTFNTPTAIVELTGTSTPNLVGTKDVLRISNLISTLSLFRVGGIEFITYNTHIDSIFPSTAISTEKIHLLKSGSYLIKDEGVETLKAFWSNMKKVKLPITTYISKQQEPDELSIAYERYSDSLEEGIIEKRISSAVMGLEALYLTEIDELSYRLSMRAGKLLSLIGYSPSEVRERIKDAYNEVRSKYVHGVILKQKDRQKLEIKYGDINEFSKTIMDYLRASIVALLLRKISKTSLLQEIDDSFLDSTKEEEIRHMLFMPYEKEVFNATG